MNFISPTLQVVLLSVLFITAEGCTGYVRAFDAALHPDAGTDVGNDAGQDAGTPPDPTVDAGTPVDGGSVTSCSVGTSEWLAYGHDPQRTFASDGCVVGPLTQAWRYVPTPPVGLPTRNLFHALARTEGAYLQWSHQSPWGSQYRGTTAVDRVSTTGTTSWSFSTPTDTTFGNWGTFAFGSFITEDDGLYFVDLATGQQKNGTGFDWWGTPAFDGTRLFLTGTFQAPDCGGAGIMTGAVDANIQYSWQRNHYQGPGPCGDLTDSLGGLTVDNGAVFYAPQYGGSVKPLPYPSGIYAFASDTGTPKWFQPTLPTSEMSAGNGKIYLIETQSDASRRLVSRNQVSGLVAWSVAVSTSQNQSPVLADGLVLLTTPTSTGKTQVTAFHANDGNLAWNSSIAFTEWNAFSFGPWGTALAAATGSHTLIVTADDGLHLLKLSDGTEQWSGSFPEASTGLRDPVVVGKTVYALASDGTALFSFSSP